MAIAGNRRALLLRMLILLLLRPGGSFRRPCGPPAAGRLAPVMRVDAPSSQYVVPLAEAVNPRSRAESPCVHMRAGPKLDERGWAKGRLCEPGITGFRGAG